MDIIVGIVVVRQVADIRIDISAHSPFVDMSGGLHIKRQRLQRFMSDHSSQPEFLRRYACVVLHVLEERVGSEGSVGGDCPQGGAESAMQLQILQPALRQSAVPYLTETMDGVRQLYGTAVQTREEVLQLRRVRAHVRQVRTQIGVREIGQSDHRHVAVENQLVVIAHRHVVERKRVERSAKVSLQADRTVEAG